MIDKITEKGGRQNISNDGKSIGVVGQVFIRKAVIMVMVVMMMMVMAMLVVMISCGRNMANLIVI